MLWLFYSDCGLCTVLVKKGTANIFMNTKGHFGCFSLELYWGLLKVLLMEKGEKKSNRWKSQQKKSQEIQLFSG